MIVGNYQSADGQQTFGYTIEPPEPQDDTEDMNIAILAAVAEAGPEGIRGVRNLVKAVNGNNDAKHTAIKNLVDAGMLDKSRNGKADCFTLTNLGLILLSADE